MLLGIQGRLHDAERRLFTVRINIALHSLASCVRNKIFTMFHVFAG